VAAFQQTGKEDVMLSSINTNLRDRSTVSSGIGALVAGMLAIAPLGVSLKAATPPVTRFVGPTNSQPLALTADGSLLVVANPDNNSVSFFDVLNDRNLKLVEVPVQAEPWGVAFRPDGRKAYVANTVAGTVSMIRTNIRNGVIHKPKHIAVGTEPYGLALTPNGTRLYVTNARSNSVTVINTANDNIEATIPNVGFEPRGIAITNDGDGDDTDEKVYVTQFLSLPTEGKVDGQDDAKRGFVTVISAATNTVLGQTAIEPIADTGFLALGDALARIPPGDPADPANFRFPTGAYPNQLNGIAIKGNFAYLPNTGASPNGPVRFDVNTHSLLSVIDRTSDTDANQTINMHTAVRDQTAQPKRFLTLPWAIAFENASNEAYVVTASSDVMIKLVTDGTDGSAAVQFDPSQPAGARVLEIAVGKSPRGVVVSPDDTRAYVMNYISRDVSVIDLTSSPESVLATLTSAALPAVGTLADTIHIGKELYITSVGTFDPAPNTTTPIVGRMSNNGWGSCAGCHTPFATTDNVVWIFPAGPRRSIPQHTDFDQSDPIRSQMRPLLWSANRDEQEDFTNNIRAVSGGQGLIVLADGLTQDTNTPELVGTANGGRNQLKVRGVGAWDAIKAFVQFGIRSPISPLSQSDPDVIAGRALFQAANCQSCHGTAQWTTARVRFTPPPDAAQVVNAEIIAELRSVGTFDAAFFNEIRQNAAPPLGADGFVPPSLLSIHAFPQTFFHNGVATSLDEVMENVTHRASGTGGVDTLTSGADRARLVRFLLSIDAATPPINP
jgi:YVTN family beta-propeller protein